jgi:hypothetical protein
MWDVSKNRLLPESGTPAPPDGRLRTAVRIQMHPMDMVVKKKKKKIEQVFVKTLV